MLNVAITYNPYFVETSIKIDGKVIPGTSPLCEMCRHERLQNWIDKFLDVLCDDRRDKEAVIDFKGTELDAEDVKSAIQDYNDRNPGHNFSIGKIESGTSQQNRVDDLKKLFEDGTQGPFSEIFQSPEMQAAFGRALDPAFEVYVVATMSSGKSTVLNALVGMELLPAKNEACTATIARIQDDDKADFFTAQRFDKDGKPLSEVEKADIELLEKWNDDPQTSRIEINGDIPTVQQTDERRMVFVDTPGPNNSRDSAHRRITLEAIRSKPLSMVLYVLNATSLSVNDDKNLLDEVCKAMSAGGRQAQDRFIFVLNKIDAFDPGKHESVRSALETTREYLRNAGIENPLIVPVSARLAKLRRIKRNGGKLTPKEKIEYPGFVCLFVEEPEMNMVKQAESRLGRGCMRRLEERIEKAKGNDEDLAEIYSGIPIVEELLNDFLQKHALPAKLRDAVDTFSRVMQEAKIAEEMNKQLNQDEEDIQAAVSKIQAFQEDEKRLEMGKKFRQKISDMAYAISPQGRTAIEDIYKRLELAVSMLQESLNNSQATPETANQLVNIAVQQCEEFNNEVIITLKESLSSEYFAVMNHLRAEYQSYVENVLKETFPEDSPLRELQTAALTMPPVSELIHDNTETVEKVVRYETEGLLENWNLFKLNWSKESRTRPIWGKVDCVNLANVAEKMIPGLRTVTRKNIESFTEQASACAETAKASVLGAMEKIDRKVAEVQSQLIEAQKDKSEREAIRRENQEKLTWIKDFNQRLQNILSV